MTLLDLNPILEKRKLSALKNGLVDSSDALKAINICLCRLNDRIERLLEK